MSSELIERLEKASEGSRELDADLIDTLFCCQIKRERQILPSYVWHTGDGEWKLIPHLTTSLDAIVSLIEEKSPLRGPVSLLMAGSGQCAIDDADTCGRGVQAFGNTPALACCIALLRALQASQGSESDG